MLTDYSSTVIQISFAIGILVMLAVSLYLCRTRKNWKPMIWWVSSFFWAVLGGYRLMSGLQMTPDGTDFFYNVFSLQIQHSIGHLTLSLLFWFRGLFVLLK